LDKNNTKHDNKQNSSSKIINLLNKVIKKKIFEYKQKKLKDIQVNSVPKIIYKCFVCKYKIIPNKVCTFHAYDHMVCEYCFNEISNNL